VRHRGPGIVQAISALILLLVVLSPLLMLFVASLKDERHQILADMGSWRAFWVDQPSLNNYREIWGLSGALPFGRYLFNSVVILAVTVAAGLLVNSLAAYVLAWGRLRGRGVILGALVALYIVPTESVLMPLLFVVNRIGLTDTYAAQILPFVANPLFIFLFYQFFIQIPRELVEAAAIDGAGPFHTWRAVFLPLSLPVMATVAVLLGLEMWNQYLWPLMVTRTDAAKPISVAVAGFFGTDEVYWDQAMAASVLMTVPILLFYFAFQRWFIASFLSSAVKG
jgi:multiple sugar transport system permease protein